MSTIKQSKGDEYRRATSAAMVVNEDMFSPKTIVLNTHLAERVAWSIFRLCAEALFAGI